MNANSSNERAGKPILDALNPDVATLLKRYASDREPHVRDQLAVAFMPLARKLAQRYVRSSEASEDLLQVANLGLLKALERFDPERGTSFGSFAVPTILGELRRHFRDATWALHVPRRSQERLQPLEQATARLTATHHRAPTVQELAEMLGWSVDDVLDGLMARRAYRAETIDAPGSGDSDEGDGLGVLDSLGFEELGYGRAEDRATVAPLIARLSTRERRILYLRYVGERTQSEIAAEIGISQMHVSRILAATLADIAAALGVAREI